MGKHTRVELITSEQNNDVILIAQFKNPSTARLSQISRVLNCLLDDIEKADVTTSASLSPSSNHQLGDHQHDK
ncbi:MAG: hypothetical protein ACR2MD_05405 [Aridibacter sp.]